MSPVAFIHSTTDLQTTAAPKRHLTPQAGWVQSAANRKD
jgi:hypothetical protein